MKKDKRLNIYLGGTICSGWRHELMSILPDDVAWYNPICSDYWSEERENEREIVKAGADVLVFFFSPLTKFYHTIAEYQEELQKAVAEGHPEKIVLLFLPKNKRDENIQFAADARLSCEAMEKAARNAGAHVCERMLDIANYLRSFKTAVAPAEEEEIKRSPGRPKKDAQ